MSATSPSPALSIIFALVLTLIHSPSAFASFTDIGAGLTDVDRSAVAWGDYDNDGDLDILLTGRDIGDNEVSLIYQNNAGVFTDIAAGLTSVDLSSVAWGDYDNDGDLDILLTGLDSGGNEVSKVYQNNNAGVFTDIAAGLTGVLQGSVAWGDYDNDGDFDILLTGLDSGSNYVSKVYQNNAGVFTDIAAGLTGVRYSSVDWGDYDNDGDLDILLTGEASGINPVSKVYQNNAGVFTDIAAGLTGVRLSSAAWGDYDNDGDLDILLTGLGSGNIEVSKVYQNNAGVFTDIAAGLTGVRFSSAAWGDYDNDGDLDILLTGEDSGSNIVSLVYQNNAGVFTDIAAGLTGVQLSSVAWGDYDNDGDLDILLTGEDSGSNEVSALYRNDAVTPNTPPTAPTNLNATRSGGSVTFSWDPATDAETPAAGLSYNLYVGTAPLGHEVTPSMADNGTGYRRVVELGGAQNNTTWTIDPPATQLYWSVQAVDGAFAGSPFAAEETVLPPFTDIGAGLTNVRLSSAAWGDYDNDGDLDILLTGYDGSSRVSKVYQNNAGVFTDIAAGLTDVWQSSVAWGDYDNDGDLDILLTGLDSGNIEVSKVYQNNAGVFTDIAAGLTGVQHSSAAWGDYDNDGDLDILLAGFDGSNRVSKVYQNNAGVFTDIAAGLTGVNFASVTWGDYDNDGDLDILLTGLVSSFNRVSKVYQNNAGVFTDIAAGLTDVSGGSVAWGDYDNDGDLDILLTGWDSGAPVSKIYQNNAGAFTDIAAGLAGVQNASVAWGDYDNDGDLDILLTGEDSVSNFFSLVYQNNAGVFTDIAAGLTDVKVGSVAWGDYDNDGDLDILLTGLDSGSNSVSMVYQNTTTTPNTPPAAPTNLNATRSGGSVTFSWDPATDAETPAAGLSYNLYVGTAPLGHEVAPSMADNGTGYRRVVELGGAQNNTTWTIDPPATQLYWSVQAVDGAFAGSPFAAEETVLPPFTGIAAGLTDVYFSSAAWGDYDNDGDLDILLTGADGSNRVSKVYQNNAGVFTDIAAGLTDVWQSSVAWGDYDNDGDLDILLTGYDGSSLVSKVYQNNAGVFTDIAAGLTGVNFGSVAWGDYDNDGDLDILLTGGNTRVSKVYQNNGGVFTDIAAGLTGVKNSSVAWGDYDNDGDLDILLTGSVSAFNRVSKVYQNNAGIFTDIAAGLTDVSDGSVAWGDYDNDGDLDILLTGLDSGSNSVSMVYQNNAGVFSDIAAGLTGVHRSSVAWGDYENDGDLDILLTGFDGSSLVSKVYQNNAGVFTDIAAGLTGVQLSSVAWGDYDNDGDLDILLTGQDFGLNSVSELYQNNVATPNTPPAAPTNLNATLSAGGVTFSWDPATDAETPAAGLSYNLYVGTSPLGHEVAPSMADNGTGYRRVVELGGAQNNTTWTIDPPAGQLYWSVQAVDGAYAGSNFPPEQVFENSFQELGAGLTGVYGSSVAWGDYDNDGDLDILLTGLDSGFNPVSKVYQNNAGVFTDIAAGLTGVELSSVAWGDYDNDGDLDILLTGQDSGSNPVSMVYQNNAGAFTDIAAGLTGVSESSVAWGDYDNDGDLDIFLTGLDGISRVSKVYQNNAGVFSDIAAGLAIGGFNTSGAWGDYDNDGDLDILLTGLDGSSRVSKVYQNNAGVFTDIAAGLTGVSESSVAWGDYDSDGDLDILLTGDDGSSYVSKVYQNNAGVFTDIAAGLTAVSQGSVAWGDYDNDGDLDILMTGFDGSSRVSKVYQNNAGVFADIAAGLTGVRFSSVAWGDYDNDGDLDILLTGLASGFNFVAKVYQNNIGTPNTPPTAPTNLNATLSAGGVTFSWDPATDAETPAAGLSYNLYVGTSPLGHEVAPSMADNGTGYRRVVQLGRAQNNTPWTIDPPATQLYWSVQAIDGAYAGSNFASEQLTVIPFDPVGVGLTGVRNSSVAWGDYDNDGDIDILLTGQDSGSSYVSKVYQNNAGVFTDITAGLTGVRNSSVAWGDYDNDGDLDILLTGEDSGFNEVSKVYQNNAGVFTDIAAGLAGVQLSSVAWGDYDNDGDLDILLTGRDIGGTEVSLIYQNNGGVFTDIAAGLTGVRNSSVAWGDYDNDGDLDILLTGYDGSSYVSKVYQNNAGVFSDIAAGLTGVLRNSVAWGDYDNDGDLDILLTGQDSGVPVSKVYQNNAGVFTDIAAGLTGVEFSSVAWGDYDNDGDLDILLTGRDIGGTEVSLIYQNNGGAFTDIAAGLTGVQLSSVAWGDYDNDGDLDILLTGEDSGSNSVSMVYQNTTTTPNTPPAAPTNLNATWSGGSVTFSWDPATDAETPAAGLSYNLYVGTSPLGHEVAPSMADNGTGYRRVVQLGSAQNNTTWTLEPLTGQLYWSVQTIDGAYSGSPFAAEQIATPDPVITAITDIEGDQGGYVRINILPSPSDHPTNGTPISTYNLWRRVDSVPLLAALKVHGTPVVTHDPSEDNLRMAIANGFKLRRFNDAVFLTRGPDAVGVAPAFPPGTWSLTGSFAAAQQPQYLYDTHTLADSTEANGVFWSAFVVTAHTTTPSIWYMSPPDSGYSVDNIAPGVPNNLVANFDQASVMLAWDPAPEPDFQFYRVYRDTDPNFIPGPGTLVHETATPSWADTPGDPGGVYYKVTSVDHAGNESDPAASGSVVSAGDIPVTTFALRANLPNPFNSSTRIAFQLPVESQVTLEVFSVTGRRVRTLVQDNVPAGVHEANWYGMDENGLRVPAGIYFYRLRAGTFESTQRMVLIQ